MPWTFKVSFCVFNFLIHFIVSTNYVLTFIYIVKNLHSLTWSFSLNMFLFNCLMDLLKSAVTSKDLIRF